jgi:hypothetical protein
MGKDDSTIHRKQFTLIWVPAENTQQLAIYSKTIQELTHKHFRLWQCVDSDVAYTSQQQRLSEHSAFNRRLSENLKIK